MKASISRIKLFKSCRKAYYFKYVQSLEPVEKSNALSIGSNYHELLEKLYNENTLIVDGNFSKEMAMAMAYKKYIFPKFKVKSVEEWKEVEIGKHCLIGRVDGIADDGCLVEHKTTSLDIGESYEYNLLWDEQILAYMYMTGARKVYYTVCKKPTIRQRSNETDEAFYERMVEWYDVDTEDKIRVMTIERTDEEVEQFVKDFQRICDDMEEAEKSDNFYKCTNNCSQWGSRCEYSSICLNFDPDQEYVEFYKKERDYDAVKKG